MTSPPRDIHVTCPDCGHRYMDWYRPAINLSLDDFDDDYLKEASSMTWARCSPAGATTEARLSRCEGGLGARMAASVIASTHVPE